MVFIKKKILTLSLLVSLVIGNTLISFAASEPEDKPFTNFTLYSNCENNYTSTVRYKETNNLYSYIRCTELKGTDKASFWIDGYENGRVSQIIDTGVSDYFSIATYIKSYGQGSKVRLGGENYYLTNSSASASGLVDFE